MFLILVGGLAYGLASCWDSYKGRKYSSFKRFRANTASETEQRAWDTARIRAFKDFCVREDLSFDVVEQRTTELNSPLIKETGKHESSGPFMHGKEWRVKLDLGRFILGVKEVRVESAYSISCYALLPDVFVDALFKKTAEAFRLNGDLAYREDVPGSGRIQYFWKEPFSRGGALFVTGVPVDGTPGKDDPPGTLLVYEIKTSESSY